MIQFDLIQRIDSIITLYSLEVIDGWKQNFAKCCYDSFDYNSIQLIDSMTDLIQ